MSNQWLALLLAGALVVGLVLFVYISKFGHRRERLNQEEFRSQWQRIRQLQTQGETGWQLAVIEADKLFDLALRRSGYGGDTMGERLKRARNSLHDNNAVWAAHKLRNRLAHEQNVHLSTQFVQQAIAGFEGGLRDLGAL